MPIFEAKPNLDQQISSDDFESICRIIEVDQSDRYFVDEVRFGLVITQKQYDALEDRLKLYFHTVSG